MKKWLWIPLMMISIYTSSCNEKSNHKSNVLITAPYNVVSGGDGLKFNYDTLPASIINYGLQRLKQLNYHFPEKTVFQKRIAAVYGLDVTKYHNDIIALKISDFPEVALKKEHYLLVQDADADNDFYINPEVLYHYNKYIFNEDKSSLTLLKTKDPYLLKDLVIHYGYNGDKDLVRFVLQDFNFSSVNGFHDLIFTENMSNQKFKLRTSLLDDIENIAYGGKTKEFMSAAKDGKGYDALNEILDMIIKDPQKYEDSDRSIAYLCEKALNVGDLGTVQSFLQKNPSMQAKLAGQHDYNFERLKLFSENLMNSGTKPFTINDPDGYTNLRKEKNAQSEILQQIKSSDTVAVLEDTGNWFLVKTKEGKEGYVHRSKVK